MRRVEGIHEPVRRRRGLGEQAGTSLREAARIGIGRGRLPAHPCPAAALIVLVDACIDRLRVQGAGAVARSEKISLTIAAVVTGVLPNGNLVIQGVQEVRTNNEVRRLTVAGIVRPEDISAANTFKHTQIAEARISYGGRGDQSRVQKTPAAQALVQSFSPF
jgi:phosphotransferase system IIB component